MPLQTSNKPKGMRIQVNMWSIVDNVMKKTIRNTMAPTMPTKTP